ncbi:MAG: response regulator transcription factor [Phreatobacter sp.]|jgi:two-component system response regulator FixJ|uniref:response regulator transcription factor n=1 Tax=Phreatobacter sp. TaxID=1966341 RepID=UPI004036A90B
MSHADEIFVVDDDPAVRDALSAIFTLQGFDVTGFADGTSVVSAMRGHVPACLILDVDIPGPSGLDVLKRLKADAFAAPIFAMSGHANIPMAVDAIRSGAVDFFEKPFDAERLVGRVREVLAEGHRPNRTPGQLASHFPGMELLTPRERQVLEQIAGGASNKEAGRNLGISPRTIEVHRARIMEKIGARNAANLVRIVLTEQ